MFKLPKSLGAIAKACDQRESTRFALQCVKLEADGKSGDVVVSATDSKLLLKATVHTENADTVPVTLIDGDRWATIFGLARTTTNRVVDLDGDVEERSTTEDVFVLSAPAVAHEVDAEATFSVADTQVTVRTVPSKYPPTDDIFKQSHKVKPDYSIRVDAVLLARQLLAMAEICDREDDRPCEITLEFRGQEKPISSEMQGKRVHVAALLMPLTK